ncbi:MAG: DNRLRE domain-containing protein, partial [Planctomycetes bacterium]|nr:DNRLRE domain-containing protein [Planctomycetota bacterium]
APRHRRLAFQHLEPRCLLSAAGLFDQGELLALTPASVSADTGEKPQSKVWQYDEHWWSVLPDDSGTWLRRLDNTTWSQVLKLSSNTRAHADVEANGDLVHILLYDGTASEFLSVQYLPGEVGSYGFWALRPGLVDVALTSGVETATIDIDSTGRIWMASDARSSVEVRYSDSPYLSFSDPITIASGITSDDISAVAALPDGSVGVLWSDQNAKRFGFRVHQDGDPPANWSVNEIPASQSAESTGGGMADDHLNMAVAASGTLYAAVKTSYDSSGYPKVALLVRRPSGNWDPLYTVDTRGTRPIVVLNEDANRLIVAYTESDSGGDILFRESPMDVISFGPVGTLISGSLNNVTSTKGSFVDDLVVIAGGGGKAYGSLIRRSGSSGGSSTPPSSPDPSVPVTVSFQDGLGGYGGTQDTSVLADSANTSFGTAAELQADGRPDEAALIRWDLSSIAPGSPVQSATITVNVTNTSSQTYEIYDLLRAWSESQTTWNQASTGTAWQTAGAQGAGDRGSAVLGTLIASSSGQRAVALNAAGLATVQRWVDEPASNYGVIFQDYVNATNGVMFSSSEASNVGVRPKLTITYLEAKPADPEPDPEPDPPPVVQNQPPRVDAGADRQVELPAAVPLDGTVEDDGLPAPPGTVSVRWSKLSGPGTVEFADPTAARTTATCSQPGAYVLRLTAADGQWTVSDDVAVVASAPPPAVQNQPPRADAGADRQVELPAAV